jgi:hypothetical protein
MSVDELLGAIRAADAAGDDEAELAVATRLRVARSLETRARSRHQLVGLATTLGILFGCTVSWALATGHIATLWSQPPPMLAPEPPPAPSPPNKQPVRRRPAKPAHPAQPPETPGTHETPELPDDVLDVPTDVPEVPEGRVASDMAAQPAPAAPEIAPAAAASVDPRPPPEAAPPEVAPVPRPAAPPRPPRPAPQVVEALYRRAHDLHFHGGDPAVALAAWNAYLAAEPGGRFSIDARYNRALLLIRLRRYAEARAALAPFARGQVRPEGYRQHEAEQLVERLAQYE